jgi:hypothetical protein
MLIAQTPNRKVPLAVNFLRSAFNAAAASKPVPDLVGPEPFEPRERLI